MQTSAHEHEQLIDLILARDAEGAAALKEQHMRHVRGEWADES